MKISGENVNPINACPRKNQDYPIMYTHWILVCHKNQKVTKTKSVRNIIHEIQIIYQYKMSVEYLIDIFVVLGEFTGC